MNRWKRLVVLFAVSSVLAACSSSGATGTPTSAGTGAAGSASASARAVPYPDWTAPTITQSMTLDEAKTFVTKATGAQTEWLGPTTGPLASTASQTIVYVSNDQSYVSYANWGQGVQDAATALGWNAVILDGKGTVAGTLAAMQQAVAMKPAGIMTSADASALQDPIKQAVALGIPVVGIHATAYPGPSTDLSLYMNVASNPADIGAVEGAYAIVDSNGTAKVVHTLDNQYAIARFKAKATETLIKACSGCTFLEEMNIPISEQAAQIPADVSGLLARYGNSFYITTCCDNFYPYVATALRTAGITSDQVKLIGADGPPSAYQMIRSGEYEIATQPEPSTLFGYEAVDAIVRAMAGQAPAEWLQPVYLVTKANVDKEGGSTNQFVPSNNFACHYMNIWRGLNKTC